LRAMFHSLVAHTDAFQFAPDASDDDDDVDAAPAEPTHASSSATSTSAAGEDVSTSTQPSVTNAAELCDVCLIAPRSGVTLVKCGHPRFCGNCADTVAVTDSGCPLRRTPTFIVLRVFTAQCTLVHMRGLGIACRPSVCPSVRPSVRL